MRTQAMTDGIDLTYFSDPVSVHDLHEGTLGSIPAVSGVYLVLRGTTAEPIFLTKSGAGWFKGKDPSVSEERLNECWVSDAKVLYAGSTGNLRRRIGQLVDFAYGKSVGHYGGRLLWHLSDWTDLEIRWAECGAEESTVEKQNLLHKFEAKHGRLPFANLNGR